MKVNILYETSNAPHGGGNQFLKALKKEFLRLGVYTHSDDADIFLFNSHHNLENVKKLKRAFPNKKFIHRIDGPMRLYNSMTDTRDSVVYQANNLMANGTIFQSKWSQISNIELGLKTIGPVEVIHNAVDSEIFYKRCQASPFTNEKARIISASFSPNIRKGFNVYKFLDENLDFKEFEYVFAGNSDVKFKNIKMLGCLTSDKLANEMRSSDIYITASENDPCSNSLLESMACGLKVLALRSGGHPELINNDGNTFTNQDELLKKLKDYNSLPNSRQETTMEEVAMLYLEFFKSVLEHKNIRLN